MNGKKRKEENEQLQKYSSKSLNGYIIRENLIKEAISELESFN